ncbi:MAG: hypothetical protein ACYTGQ_07125 [Planctomycetota bacterium]|jgi:hypothetical protein
MNANNENNSNPQDPTLHFPVSLRDYFAGQALIGIMSNPHVWSSDLEPVDYTDMAYVFADAMLMEREKESND